jgi:hypothetical protein
MDPEKPGANKSHSAPGIHSLPSGYGNVRIGETNVKAYNAAIHVLKDRWTLLGNLAVEDLRVKG